MLLVNKKLLPRMNFLPSQVLRGDVEVKEGQTQHGHCPCANVCAFICHQYDTFHNNRDIPRHTETYRDIQRHMPVITVTNVVSMQRHTDSREKKIRYTETYRDL